MVAEHLLAADLGALAESQAGPGALAAALYEEMVAAAVQKAEAEKSIAAVNARREEKEPLRPQSPLFHPHPPPAPDRSGPARGVYAFLAFSAVNRVCTALLCGRAGRLTAQNGGFRPGRQGGACRGARAARGRARGAAVRRGGRGRRRGGRAAAGGAHGARPPRRFAPPTHPLHTRFANTLGASVSEMTMRPNP